MISMKNWLLCGWLAAACVASAADFSIQNEKEFRSIVPANAKVRKLADGFRFVEGPVWVDKKQGALIFSDIPANQLNKWTAKEGVTVFRTQSNGANGNTLDGNGQLLSCEHGGRRVSLTDHEGLVLTVVDRYQGKRLNSPNDIVVKTDGTLWFTDPDYGINASARELPGNYVFRYNPKNDELMPMVKDFDKPNGLCFSPNERKLYVADSGKPHHIRVFEVQKNGTIDNGKVFCVVNPGIPDGIRCDKKGRVFSSAGDGVHIFAEDGSLIGKILVPETPANLCFGGKGGHTLFITAQKSLYAIDLDTRGK